MNKLLIRLIGLALLLSLVLVVSRGVGSQAPVTAETGSQAGAWKTYTNGDYVPALAADGNHVLAATDEGGVVRWDIRDRSYVQYQQPQDGLASSSVREIAVDRQGRAWIGSWRDGVSVFDGSTWTTYDTSNSGLADNYVRAIAVDGQGRMWFGTERGVSVFDGSSWTTYDTGNSGLDADSVRAISIDGQGRMWFGTHGGGVSLFDGSTWTTYNTGNSGLVSNWISDIATNVQGRVWFWDGAEVSAFDGSTWIIYPSAKAAIEAEYSQILTTLNLNDLWTVDAATDQVWTRHVDDGIGVFDGSTWTTYDTNNSDLASNDVLAITVDSQGQVWVGTDGYGVSVFDGTTWTTHTTLDCVRDILLDSHEQVWFGTCQGVKVFDGSVWRTAHDISVQAMAIDVQGRTWFGTWGGVRVFDGSMWTTYDACRSGIASNLIRDVTIDGLGHVWVGTMLGGVSVFDGEAWVTYGPWNSGLAHNKAHAIALDGQGRMWVGTWGGGVSAFDGSTWATYDTSNSGLADNHVSAISVDEQGRVWVGTRDDGVSVFDGSAWTTYTVDNTARRGDQVTSVLERTLAGYSTVEVNVTDQAVNYFASGLHVMFGTDPTVYRIYSVWIRTNYIEFEVDPILQQDVAAGTPVYAVETGLASNWVSAIGSDARGRMWIGTDRGVSVFDGMTWTSYTPRNSGLGDVPVVVIAGDNRGRVWFGLENGVSVLEEDGTRSAPMRPEANMPSLGGTSTSRPRTTNASIPESTTIIWRTYANGDNVRSLDVHGNHAWVGTWGGGVVRWDMRDGSRRQYLRPQDGLLDNGVYDIAIDGQGRVWSGTDYGVSVLDGSVGKAYTPSNSSLDEDRITELVVDNQGRVWMGRAWVSECGNGFVSVFDGDTWKAYCTGYGPMDTAADAQGRVWFAMRDGVLVFDGCTWTYHYMGWLSYPGRITVNADGRVWVSAEGGVWVFDGGTWAVHPDVKATIEAEYDAVLRTIREKNDLWTVEPSTGRVWITEGDGASVFDGSTWITYTVDNSDLIDDDVRAMAIDEQGRAWFWTLRGVSVFDGRSWTTYDARRTSLVGGPIGAMAIDDQGRLWVGSADRDDCYITCIDGGVSVFDGSTWTTYNTSNSDLAGDSVQAIASDGQGRMWFGTYGGGLSVFDGSTWTTYNTSNSGLVDNDVVAITSDGQGRMWFGTWSDGVSVFDGSTWTTYGGYQVRAIASDEQGRVWLGTYGDGVSVFDGSTWTTYDTSNSGLADDDVQAIAGDGQGRMWLGTYGGGVSVFDGSTWTTYNISNSGLADNDVRAITSDGQERMWFGTDRGVSVFDGSTWTIYDTSNSGLVDNDVQAIAIDNQGRVWIGTEDGGVSVFVEVELTERVHLPLVMRNR